MRHRSLRRVAMMAASAAAITSLGGALLGAVAAPASASTAQVNYICTTTAFGVDFDNSITLLSATMTAPVTVDAGLSAPVTIDVSPIGWNLPFDATNAVAVLQASVGAQRVGGGASATASGTGAPTAPTTIPSYSTFPVTQPLTVDVPTTSAGFIIGDKIDFTPGEITITLTSADDGLAGATTSCILYDPAPSLARTTVYGAAPASPSDRCIAQTGDTTGPPGCTTDQIVKLEVTSGRLTQRAYQTGINPSSTVVDLGSIASPLAPTAVTGALNQITVSDNRGGSFGWSLTAALTDFTGVGGNTISKARLAITPGCAVATASTAYDYDAVGQTPIAGFDPSLSAAGQSAGSAGQPFSGPVQLCTKSTQVNTTTESSGGVYNVTAGLVLDVPAFQAADQYAAIMTVTLA